MTISAQVYAPAVTRVSGDDPVADVATVPEILARGTSRDSSIVFVDRRLRSESLPYRELHEASERCARSLAAAGINPGERVCVVSPTSPALVCALFGVWRAGAVPTVLPLPRRQGEMDAYAEEVAQRIRFTEAVAILAADELASFLPSRGNEAKVLSIESALKESAPLAPKPNNPPGDLALLQFTSGTTGKSRAVALTHQQVISNLSGLYRAIGYESERDVGISWLPLYHDMGLMSFLAAVADGVPLVLQPTEQFLANPVSWLQAVSVYGGTCTAAPNFAYRMLATVLARTKHDLDLSSMRLAINGAEPIEAQVVDSFLNAASRYGFRREAMCPMYGLAEATVGVTITRPDEPIHVLEYNRDQLELNGRAVRCAAGTGKTLVSCGKPIPGTRLSIRDDNGRDLPRHRVGEIWIKGRSVMTGYWNDPAATSESVRDGWLRTGDLGFWGVEGLVPCGRKKDMIIVGGRNFYPEDYEYWAERNVGIRPGGSIAFGLSGSEQMVVVAELAGSRQRASEVAQSVMRKIACGLPRAPEEVLIVAPRSLPRTSSGKRQRSLCKSLYQSGTLEVLASACRKSPTGRAIPSAP